MTRTGHHLTGLGCGVIFAAGFHHVWPNSPWWLAVPAAWFGGVAPDRLEYIGRARWVKHRTLTHWGLLWVGMAAGAGMMAVRADFPSWLVITLAGFAVGGLSHLLGDWPNPMGVPWFLPTRRHSLNWWQSGQHEIEIVAVVAGLAWLSWRAV